MRIQRNKKRKQCKQLVIKNCNFQCSNWSHIIVHVKLIFSEILSKEKSLGWECREIKKKKKKGKTVQPIGHQNLCISVQQLLLFHSLCISQGFIFYHRKSLSLCLSVYLYDRYCQNHFFVCLIFCIVSGLLFSWSFH